MISTENIIINPGNKKQTYKIHLEDDSIVIPKNEICIGVEWIGKPVNTKKIHLRTWY